LSDFEEIVLGQREKGKKSAFAIALIVFAVYLFIYQGPAEGYWDTYIAVPAAVSAGVAVDFRGSDGEPAYEYGLAGTLPEDLVQKDTFGIATKDQRVGAAILAAPFFKLFRVFGFRLLYALIPALTALIFFSVVHRATTRRWLAFLAAGVLLLNPFMLSFQRMNANFTALLLLTTLFLVMETDPVRPFFAGLLLGVLGGVRNMGIIFAPIFLLWVYFSVSRDAPGKPLRKKAAGLRGALLFGAGAFVAILPFMLWKEFAFGSPFAHPSQYAHFQGFRPTFLHSIMGLEFRFNGLLNYPFIDSFVRTPHFSFPVFLLLPLVILRSFGMVLFALAFLGVSVAFNTDRKRAWYVLAWLVIGYFFWAFQENWEELKMSFLMLQLPPLVLLMAFGLQRLTAIGGVRRNVISLLAALILLTVGLKFCFYLEFPQDQRWYQRFPKAAVNASELDGLPPEKRLDPEFFLTRETDEERLAEKKRFTAMCLIPCAYLPLDTNADSWGTEVRHELDTRVLKVRNVWDTIYAQTDGGD